MHPGMLRATPFLMISRNTMHRFTSLPMTRVASACATPVRQKSYSQVQERYPCPPLPPPPPPPKDRRLLWGTLALAVLTGYCVVAAKQSPEVRDWLTIYVPWFDDFIALVYEENQTYEEQARALVEYLQQWYAYKKNCPKQISSDGDPVPEQPPCQSIEDYTNDKPPNCEEKIEDEECKPPPPLPPILTKDVCNIDECLKDRGDSAYYNYLTARDACKYYNQLVEDNLLDFNVAHLKALRPAMIERKELVSKHIEDAERAVATLDELNRFLNYETCAARDVVANAKHMLSVYQAKIANMKTEFIWENDMSEAMDVRWQQVEDIINKYISENETMFPSVKYDAAKPHIQDDGDLLLHHTIKYKKKLRAMLDEVVTAMSERVNRGIETLPQDEKKKKENDYQLQTLHKTRKCELDKWYKKRIDDLKAENDQTAKDAKKKLCERHEENMKIKLKQKEEEAHINLNKMVDEAVAAEKKRFARDLEHMSIKLKVVEAKLEARLKAEREARRSQELYTAGVSLLAATKRGTPRVCVNKELNALEKAAGDNDKLVVTVLKSIPPNVRDEGVVPESVLRERYHSMEKIALRVALVEQEGAPLPVYIMSFIQSLFLFMKLEGIPQEDIDKPLRENAGDLDSFDCLQRARYWVDRGNIPAAVRYVGFLEGASRAAAESWHRDARAHLEIRQAAEAVLAHATALGLQYV